MDVWEHARGLTSDLTGGLARLELRLDPNGPGERAPERLEAALAGGWEWVIARARENAVRLVADFVAQLHRVIAGPLGIPCAGEFSNGTPPESWTAFVRELESYLLDGSPLSSNDAWIVSQMVWGGHVSGLGLSTGWLLLNGLRLQEGRRAIYPIPELDQRFVQDLGYSGPDLFDAEPLRAMFSSYTYPGDYT